MFIKKIDWFTIVLTDTYGGGSELQQIQLFTHLVKNNKKCYVICLAKKKMGAWEFMENQNSIIYFPFSDKFLKVNFVLLCPFLCYFFLTHKIKYSFTTQTLINSCVGVFKFLGLLNNTKVIVRESNSIFDLLKGSKLKRYKLAYKIGYSKVDLVICQTDYMKEQLLKSLPWLSGRVNVRTINNPIDLGLIKEKSKEKVNILPPLPFVVAAGSLHPKKGFDILINAFNKILEHHPNLHLVILGEGAEREKLTNQVKDLKLEHRVHLLGFVTNVYSYFKKARLCVMSSRIEGFPNVLLQMMSQNTNVLSTLSAGGIEEIPGIYTAPVNDEEALFKSMVTALKNDNDKNRTLFDQFLVVRGMDSFVNEILVNTTQE